MTRWVLAAAILILLAGIAAAEPQPVDSDWQRSDGVPVEIGTLADAPPETAEEAEGEADAEEAEGEAGTAWVLYGAVGACGLYALTAAVLWVRRTRRARR